MCSVFENYNSVRRLFAQAQAVGIISRNNMLLSVEMGEIEVLVLREDIDDFERVLRVVQTIDPSEVHGLVTRADQTEVNVTKAEHYETSKGMSNGRVVRMVSP